MPGAGLPPRETTKQDTQTDVLLWHARRDSNPQPSEPESDALSITLLAHVLFDCQVIIAKGRGIVKGNFHEFYEIFPWRTVGKTGREGLPPGGFHGRVVFVKLDAFASQKQPKGVLIVSFSFSGFRPGGHSEAAQAASAGQESPHRDFQRQVHPGQRVFGHRAGPADPGRGGIRRL